MSVSVSYMGERRQLLPTLKKRSPFSHSDRIPISQFPIFGCTRNCDHSDDSRGTLILRLHNHKLYKFQHCLFRTDKQKNNEDYKELLIHFKISSAAVHPPSRTQQHHDHPLLFPPFSRTALGLTENHLSQRRSDNEIVLEHPIAARARLFG